MSDMLEKYTLKYKGKNAGKKEYNLSFKVAKDVKVTFSQVGDIHKIDLNIDTTTTGGENHDKNYNITGPLKIQFFQHPAVGIGKDGPPPPPSPDPSIDVEP